MIAIEQKKMDLFFFAKIHISKKKYMPLKLFEFLD